MHSAYHRSVVLGLCAAIACASASCGRRPPEIPADAAIGASVALPTPRVEPNQAAPAILKMHFSSLDVRRGQRWTGEFVTGTSVASVEVRTNLFSIDVPRAGSGRFGFALNVLDAPPIFIRAYRLRVIARNSGGREYEQDLPFELR
jgi:hypothetical protein